MEFDPRLTNLGISVTETTNATWDIAVVKYQDPNESGGKHHIYFFTRDANGNPEPGVTCIVDWVGREEPQPFKTQTDTNGEANFPMFANLNTSLKNGPYFAFIESDSNSDIVRGMGLPEKHHVCYWLTFQPQTAQLSLDQAVQAEAKKSKWMPINDKASLYQFAQKNSLGYPQTDEFEFTYGGVPCVAQVYNYGIVYVKKGDWANCKWVKKPE